MGSAWKTGRKAAVSLTFDDGMSSHVNVAAPALEAQGMRGTFYLMTKDAAVVERFRPLATAGHEIGNHSVAHPCSGATSLDPDYRGLESWTLDEMERELSESDERLRSAYPGTTEFSFAYPCYNTFVGVGEGRRSYVPLVAKRFAAARAGNELSTAFNDPHRVDLHCVSTWKCEGMEASELTGIVERTCRSGTWSVLAFHGIGEGHLLVSEGAFLELVAYLGARREEVWAAPFLEVARYVREIRG